LHLIIISKKNRRNKMTVAKKSKLNISQIDYATQILEGVIRVERLAGVDRCNF
jgi:hypothetical protein